MPLDWTTRNELTLAKLEPVFAGRVRALIAYIQDTTTPPVAILITRGLATWAEQNKLFKQVPKVTDARGGYSQHNYGLAVDLCPDNEYLAGYQLDWNINHPVWQMMLAKAPYFGLAEGAEWEHKDNPHFYPVEIPSTTAELRIHYASGKLPAVWRWFASLREQATTNAVTTNTAKPKESLV